MVSEIGETASNYDHASLWVVKLAATFLATALPHIDLPACMQYTRNTANVIAVEDSLGQARRQVFAALQGTPLHVVLCDVVGHAQRCSPKP